MEGDRGILVLGGSESVKITDTIVACEKLPFYKIIHKEIERVKFNGYLIIPSKFTNKDQFFNNLRNMIDIFERVRMIRN